MKPNLCLHHALLMYRPCYESAHLKQDHFMNLIMQNGGQMIGSDRSLFKAVCIKI